MFVIIYAFNVNENDMFFETYGNSDYVFVVITQ